MDNLRKVAALALHEVRSLAANPSMVATIFVLLSFALLFTDFFHFFEWFSVPFLCQLAVCSIGGIGTVCILAEERERGAEQTLLLSGTNRATIAAGKVIGCIIVCELVSFICAFGITRDLGRAGEPLFFCFLPLFPSRLFLLRLACNSATNNAHLLGELLYYSAALLPPPWMH